MMSRNPAGNLLPYLKPRGVSMCTGHMSRAEPASELGLLPLHPREERAIYTLLVMHQTMYTPQTPSQGPELGQIES